MNELELTLQSWVAEEVGDPGALISGVRRTSAGFSRENWVFDATWTVDGHAQTHAQGDTSMIARIATFPTLPPDISAEVRRNVLERFMPALRAQECVYGASAAFDAVGKATALSQRLDQRLALECSFEQLLAPAQMARPPLPQRRPVALGQLLQASTACRRRCLPLSRHDGDGAGRGPRAG